MLTEQKGFSYHFQSGMSLLMKLMLPFVVMQVSCCPDQVLSVCFTGMLWADMTHHGRSACRKLAKCAGKLTGMEGAREVVR